MSIWFVTLNLNYSAALCEFFANLYILLLRNVIKKKLDYFINSNYNEDYRNKSQMVIRSKLKNTKRS
jgi:non-homologous end joining protein Ku